MRRNLRLLSMGFFALVLFLSLTPVVYADHDYLILTPASGPVGTSVIAMGIVPGGVAGTPCATTPWGVTASILFGVTTSTSFVPGYIATNAGTWFDPNSGTPVATGLTVSPETIIPATFNVPSNFSPGTYTVAVLFTPPCDTLEGNPIASFTVQTPANAIQTLIGQVQSLGPPTGPLNSGQVNSLVVKLSHAIAKLESGQTKPACNMLGAFISDVQALVANGTLTPAQGNPLIAEAQAIQAAVPC